MTAGLKPATPKARILLEKLQALAEKGIDGERTSAQHKIARLKARFDFSGEAPTETPDLFSGTFKRATKARRIYRFNPNELDVANAVKWAIESATGMRCVFRNADLFSEAAPPTAERLKEVADRIACSFRSLLAKFTALDGVNVSDRSAFVMGLYDGMMNETREAGQRLPSRALPAKKPKGRKTQATGGASLHLHPYTLAVSLGKRIRFSAPVEQITAELESVIQKHLAAGRN